MRILIIIYFIFMVATVLAESDRETCKLKNMVISNNLFERYFRDVSSGYPGLSNW